MRMKRLKKSIPCRCRYFVGWLFLVHFRCLVVVFPKSVASFVADPETKQWRSSRTTVRRLGRHIITNININTNSSNNNNHKNSNKNNNDRKKNRCNKTTLLLDGRIYVRGGRSFSLSSSTESFDQDPSLRKNKATLHAPPITETATALPELEKIPDHPKIVVLGATGSIGSIVVRQLLESSPDGTTVVAVVRDYDKACRVLYDDLILMKQNRKGPKLQIVTANLVPRSDMPVAVAAALATDYKRSTLQEQEWLARAKSAARFYGNQVADYDDDKHDDGQGAVSDRDDYDTGALAQAVQGCTAIVSCVSSVRPSQPWRDWWPPMRLLRKDVRPWCGDASHPYYTQYHVTRKVLHLAEREQVRRNALFLAEDNETFNSMDDMDGEKEKTRELQQRRRNQARANIPRRIRFVRLSDLAVTQQPWHLVPLVTNALRSMIFRYHEMADNLVTNCRLLDTVVVRPGEIVDEERDEDQVGVQVQIETYHTYHETTRETSITVVDKTNHGGENTHITKEDSLTPPRYWSPARVGQEDVAALLTAATLAPWMTADNNQTLSVHYTLAVRWCGNTLAMAPYPGQGEKTHGCRTAAKSLQKAVQKWKRRGQDSLTTTTTSSSSSSSSSLTKSKPYGVWVALPIYLMFALFLRNLVQGMVLASRGAKRFHLLPAALLPDLLPVWQAMVRFLLVRRGSAVQYISF